MLRNLMLGLALMAVTSSTSFACGLGLVPFRPARRNLNLSFRTPSPLEMVGAAKSYAPIFEAQVVGWGAARASRAFLNQ